MLRAAPFQAMPHGADHLNFRGGRMGRPSRVTRRASKTSMAGSPSARAPIRINPSVPPSCPWAWRRRTARTRPKD